MNAPIAPHPTDQILQAYGLGKLGDPAASAVDVHLEACPACRQRVSELSGDSFVSRLRDAGTPAGAAAAVSKPSSPNPPPPAVESPKAPASNAPAPDSGLSGKLPAELAANEQYTVLRELGRGGMGVVYLARNTLMERLEVLKVLNKEMLERKGTYDRFLREVRAAARLAHPNVVGAYSAVQVGRLLAFAMEYVDGADLSQLVKSRGPLPVAHACSFAAQAALGLQHAHERGMVHRDIKPANLMLTRQGQRGIVKILDFGLAKATSENPIDGGLTREGQMLGTPDYMAPEQTLDASNADIRADIYSLGCTLYYLLTGGPPFDGTSLWDILQAHHLVEARPLNLVRPEVPVELAAVVAKMMAKERERRYQTPAEVAAALKPYFTKGTAKPGACVLPSAPELPLPSLPEPVPTPEKPAAAWTSLLDVKADSEPPLAAPRSEAAGQRRPRGHVLAAATVFGVVVLGVIISVAIDKGRTKIAAPGGGRPAPTQAKKVPDGSAPGMPNLAVGNPTKADGDNPRAPTISPTTITNSVGMKLVLVPAGEFLMGSPGLDSEASVNERPQHKVLITPPFYLGVTEVTQGQYRAVTGPSPSAPTGSYDLPAVNVSWNDAKSFCDKLGASEGASYRLPTEAEWEYACRAGSKTKYCFGDDEASLDEVAWFNGNSGIRSYPVGKKRPNAWGLYDMHGNVREWCWNLAYTGYSGEPTGADPLNSSKTALRAVRGGCFYGNAWLCRSACRLGYEPDYRKGNLGFRVARVQSSQ